MNLERFQQELSLIPVVKSLSALSEELRAAAAGSAELRRLVDERIRCDRLLEQAPTIDPPLGFAASTVERALAEEGCSRLQLGRPAGSLRWLRSPLGLAAAAVVLIAFALIYLSSEDTAPATDSIDPELLASLDLLLDWEVLEEHQVELDLLASNELASALDEFGEEADQLR